MIQSNQPLAERMRPKTLDDFLGQEAVLSDSSMIKRAISTGLLPSMIFWGPPGVGKTSLALLLAEELKRPHYALSAISSGVKDVREVIAKASDHHLFQTKAPILFIDEIHRFNKSQQDALLGAVEKGEIVLIGATTENPSFEVIPALLSRCQVFTLEAFDQESLLALLNRAMLNDPWLKAKHIELRETTALLKLSGGDGRKLLNLFELVVGNVEGEKVVITDDLVDSISPDQMARYDKTGEQHYDIISAFIKSIRGSDPNAAVYWLARMIEGGEDIKFIARRMIISASEDIGLANPTALILANSTFDAVSKIGYPEGRILLSQCAVYLATSPKSNSTYKAIGEAQKLVRETGDLPVPLHLRNAPTKLMKDLGYGKDYAYSHDGKGNFIDQEYLPEAIKKTVIYHPGSNDREGQIHRFLKSKWGDQYGY